MRKVPIRHLILWKLLCPLVAVFLFIKFGYRFKLARKLPKQYIVLANHVTDYDPLFTAVSFPRQMYFVGSEHIARWKLAYPLIKWAFQPILRYKGTSAASTVMEMLRAIRAGGNVCMFAEGARCWDGVTAPILLSTGKVVKSAKCALVTYKIQGGYFASPNWSEQGTRRGRVTGSVVNIYTKEQLASMSVDEINTIINQDLHEDAYERQLASPTRYRGKQIAYRMENMLFHCPNCRAIDSVSSKKDTVTCSECGHSFRYTEYGMLEGCEFKTIKELFAWQKEQVFLDAGNNKAYVSPSASLYTIDGHQQVLLSRGQAQMDSGAFSCGDTVIALDKITDMAMHGRRALVFSVGETYYELIMDDLGCALKFLLLYQVYVHGKINRYN